jgi:hypothetical protein
MKICRKWLAAGLLTLALTPGVASATGVELSLGIFNQSPHGDISFRGGLGWTT